MVINWSCTAMMGIGVVTVISLRSIERVTMSWQSGAC